MKITLLAYLLFSPIASSFSLLPGGTRSSLAPLFDAERMSERTYGSTSEVIRSLVALEARMSDFFLTHYDWQPLFRSLCADSSVPAMSFLGSHDEDIDFSATSHPWKQMEAVPSEQDEKKIVADYLDSMQQALLEKIDSDDDMAFILEGRRMLAVSRFQVVPDSLKEQEMKDAVTTPEGLLFTTCWNEVAELSRSDQPDTGSLIVLPSEIQEGGEDALQDFLSSRIEQPLEWLGLDPLFDIETIYRSSTPSALRVLHKLGTPPAGIVGGEVIRM